MKKASHHFTVAMLAAIPVILLDIARMVLRGDPWFSTNGPRYLMVTIVFFYLPDMDKALAAGHRHWFYHSLAIPILWTWLFWGIPCTSFAMFPFAVHLLADIPQERGKRPTGSYCILLRRSVQLAAFGSRLPVIDGMRLSGGATKAWLAIQGVLGIAIAIVLEVA